MDRDLVALVGFVAMFGLMALRVPIGIAMGIAGVAGFGVLTGLQPGLNLLANVPLSVLTDYNLSVIPMFILMGAFASQSGMSTELFAAGRAWLGHRRGGLALASIAACGGLPASRRERSMRCHCARMPSFSSMAGRRPQGFWATAAASTASITSASVADVTDAKTRPLAGFFTSIVWRGPVSRNDPAMKFWKVDMAGAPATDSAPK